MWRKVKVANGNLKTTIPNTDYSRSKTSTEYGIFKDVASIIKNDAGSTSKIKSRIAVSKAAFSKAKSISPANWI